MSSTTISVTGTKGGAGTSVVAASLALEATRRGHSVLLVDAAEGRDQAAIFGLASTPEPGEEVRAANEVTLVSAPEPSSWTDKRTGAFAPARFTVVVIDTGLMGHADWWVRQADENARLLVTRGDYLALRRAVHAGAEAWSGLVVVEEAQRSLDRACCGDVLDRPVLAGLPVRPAISRAVDAGLLASRQPDALRRTAARLLDRIGVDSAREEVTGS